MRTVVPPFASDPISSHIARRPFGSRPVVGSSRKMTGGCDMSAAPEVEPAAHPTGIGPHRPVGGIGQLEALDERIGPFASLAGIEAVQAAEHAQVLAAAEHLVERRVLARHADATTCLVGMAQDIDAGHGRLAGIGTRERRQDAHGGRLAGTVGAEDAEDRPLVDAEVESAEGVRLAEGLVETLGVDHRSGGLRHRLLGEGAGSVANNRRSRVSGSVIGDGHHSARTGPILSGNGEAATAMP
jgi:hypothetical protein